MSGGTLYQTALTEKKMTVIIAKLIDRIWLVATLPGTSLLFCLRNRLIRDTGMNSSPSLTMKMHVKQCLMMSYAVIYNLR